MGDDTRDDTGAVLAAADAGLDDAEGSRRTGLPMSTYRQVKHAALAARTRERHAEHMRHLDRIASALERLSGL